MIHGVEVRGDGRAVINVWAPRLDALAVELDGGAAVALARRDDGWHCGEVRAAHGQRYWLRTGDTRLADPASRWQPDDVHGPSAIVDDRVCRVDTADWEAPPLALWAISEIHVGAFSDEGTLDGAIAHLPRLVEAGINVVELMPLAEFPGARNWGYDGVFPWSVESSYGGPVALARFVRAAHEAGLAVVLDVVYNHLGPEGNVLDRFGPYFTDAYKTPWGAALNFDGAGSDDVRAYFVQSACRWVEVFGIDGLRLDAVHAIVDPSARPFVAELSDAVHAAAHRASRRVEVIAESAANDPRVVAPTAHHGLGCDAVWNDDFHHALHVALTDERAHYYADYGGVTDLAEAMEHGFILRGRYSPFRARRHGAPVTRGAGERFVVFAQNHDQIGNRPAGERLASTLPAAALEVAAAAIAFAPNVPLLFMGEEWGTRVPFPYFTSHTDPELVEAVRRGRRDEFAGLFGPDVEVPDPQGEATFASARLDWSARDRGEHRTLLDWWRALLELRRKHPALAALDQCATRARALADGHVLAIERSGGGETVLALLSFASQPVPIELETHGTWRLLLASPGAGVDGARPAADGGELVLAPFAVVVLDAHDVFDAHAPAKRS